jgi:hypothetical protein
MSNYQLVPISHNGKTGPIPVSYQSRDTCPDTCALKHGDKPPCFAEAGYHTRMNWNKLDSGERGYSFERFLGAITALPKRQLWRYAVAGDLCGKGDNINAADLRKLVKANRGKAGFTYTHKPIDNAHNRAQITLANAAGFTINISADSPAKADAVIDSGIAAPVVFIFPLTDQDNPPQQYKTPKGRLIVTCPNSIRKRTTCAQCAICADKDRGYIVGFPAHGGRRHAAALIASDATT